MSIKKPLLISLPALALAAVLASCLLIAGSFQTLILSLELDKTTADGETVEVWSSFYPNDVAIKKYFVRVSGVLTPAGGAPLPSAIDIVARSEDAETGKAGFRFKMTVKPAEDGSFSATKKYKKNIKAGTLQRVSVTPKGADIPEGSELAVCVDVVKKKSHFGDTDCGQANTQPPNEGRLVIVEIRDNEFRPKSTEIEAGDTVRWVLRGSNTDHTTSEMSNTWNSGFVFNEDGQFFERHFPLSEDGETFLYFCVTHQSCCQMQGSILVGPEAEDPPPGYG